jgi:DNA modification methylase
LPTIKEKSIDCCVTSPPYFGLRDYGVKGQIGLEQTPDEFVAELVKVFREVKRVLRDDGTLWLNLGDTYGTGTRADRRPGNAMLGKKTAEAQGIGRVGGIAKNLFGIPWRVALALQADGWYLRQDIIWSKPNPMPESVIDRCTKAHEYIFLLSKSTRYFFDSKAIAEPVAESTISRLSQDIESQEGSSRVP